MNIQYNYHILFTERNTPMREVRLVSEVVKGVKSNKYISDREHGYRNEKMVKNSEKN